MKTHRGLVGALGGALVLTVALTGCSAGAKHKDSADANPAAAKLAESPKPTVSAAVVAIQPAAGSKDVKPSGALKVSVTGGKLTTVKVTAPNGTEVPGAVAADGLSWAPTGNLQVSTEYKVSALAVDAQGVTAATTSSFTTLTPEKDAGASDNIADNETYGVGMIVSLRFERSVKNREAVAGAVSFETSDGTVVHGHWIDDTRIDFRPEKYWTPGTKVTVKYRLKSVETAPGVYGGVDKDEPFTIGRSQVSTADVNTHRMAVVRDGQQVDSVPFTAGKPGYDTWNGTMVVEGMEGRTRMTSAGVTKPGSGDEYDLTVPHAIRLTDTGTYVHGNYWSSAIGNSNASHGCIGLRDTEEGSDSSSAGKFYQSTMVGDVVTVVNSKGPTVPVDNGLGGWNVPWGSW